MFISYALVFSWVIGFILTIGFSTNILALTLAIKYRAIQKNQLDILIVSMAVADLITLSLMPFVLASAIHHTWFWGDTFCKIFQFCLAFSIAASIYSLCTISIARARTILSPYGAPRTTTTIFMLIGVWVLSLLVSLPLRIHATVETRFPSNTSLCLPSAGQQHYQVALSQFILYYLLPVFVIAFNYLQLVRFLHRSPLMSWASARNTRRASVMIFTATAVFSACWLPVYILQLCVYFKIYHHSYIWDSFYFICNILQYLHPCVNPVLYVLLSKRYRTQWMGFVCGHQRRVHPQVHTVSESKG